MVLVVIFNWECYLGDSFWWRGVVYVGIFPCIGEFNVIIWCRGVDGPGVYGYVSGLF